jgi:hypothetical protein
MWLRGPVRQHASWTNPVITGQQASDITLVDADPTESGKAGPWTYQDGSVAVLVWGLAV